MEGKTSNVQKANEDNIKTICEKSAFDFDVLLEQFGWNVSGTYIELDVELRPQIMFCDKVCEILAEGSSKLLSVIGQIRSSSTKVRSNIDKHLLLFYTCLNLKHFQMLKLSKNDSSFKKFSFNSTFLYCLKI